MKTVLGANVLTQENNVSQTRTLAIANQGEASASNSKETFWSLENYLTYSKEFNDILDKNEKIRIMKKKTWKPIDHHGRKDE